MRQLKLSVAAFLAMLPFAANADVITLEFTALGFNPGAPTDPVSGTIVYEAAGLTATIDSLISVDLTIAGHVYSLGELLFVSPLLDDVDYVGGTTNGQALSSFTTDFFILWNRVTGIGDRFWYSCAACDRLYTTSDFATFTRTAAPVPEPGALALLGIGLAAMGLVNRRRTRCGSAAWTPQESWQSLSP